MHIECISDQGTGCMNEDFHVVSGNLLAVFDGATSLTSAKYAGGRTGGFLAANIAGQAFQRNDLPLPELARRANTNIAHAMRKHGVDRSDKSLLWSTSAAAVRLHEDCFEWMQVGDSIVMAIHADGSHEIVCDYINHDLETLTIWKDISGTTDQPIAQAMKEQIRRVRADMNVTYGVLNGEDEASSFFQHGRKKIDTVKHVLLFTDGLFIPTPSPRKEESFQDIAALYLEGGLSRVRDHVRHLEAADGPCRKYPRFKQHDDISAIAVTFRLPPLL